MIAGLKKDVKMKKIGTVIEQMDKKGKEAEKEMIAVHAVINIIVMTVIVAEVVIEDEAAAKTELTEKPKRPKKKILRDKKIRKPRR